MALGDTVKRFSPDGSYFTTGGTLGLENNTPAVYGVGPSHTIACWVRPDSLPATDTEEVIFRLWSGSGAAYQIELGIQNVSGTTTFYYRVSDNAGSSTVTLESTTTPVADVWYQVLGCKNDVYSGRLFINAVSEDLLIGVPAQSDAVRSSSVGLDGYDASRNFDGSIHSITIWDLAISEEAVRAVYSGGWKDLDLRDDRNPGYNDAVNLVHWWRFGQGATDAHPAGNEWMVDWVDSGGISITEQEGVVEQSDILTVGDAPAGTSVDFDGASSMSTPTAVPMLIVNEWTVSAWIKPREVLTTDSDIIYIGPDSSEIDSILISQNGGTANDPLVVTVKDGTGTTIFAHEYYTVLSEDEWQHVAVTWDGAALNTYLDGELLTPDDTGAGAGIAQADSSRDILLGTGPLSAPVPFERENCVEVSALAQAMLTGGVNETWFGGPKWSVAGWIKPQSETPLAGTDLGIFDRSGYDGINFIRYYNRTTIKLVKGGGSLWTLRVQIWDTASAASGNTNILWEYDTPTDIEDVFTNGMNEWNFFCMTYDESQSGVGNIITMYMNGVAITPTSTTGTSITHTHKNPVGWSQISYGNTDGVGSGSETKWNLTNIMAARFHRLGMWGNHVLTSAMQSVLYNGGNPPEIDWQTQTTGAYTLGQNELTYYHDLGNTVWTFYTGLGGPGYDGLNMGELWNWGQSDHLAGFYPPPDDTTDHFLPTPWTVQEAADAYPSAGVWFQANSSWDLDGRTGTGVPDFIYGDPADSRTPVGSVTNPWNGKMGHVGIWGRVLSAEEIQIVFSKGQQMDLRYDVDGYTASSAESLQSYFKPGEDSTLLGRNFIDMNRSAGSRVLTLVIGTPESGGDSPVSS